MSTDFPREDASCIITADWVLPVASPPIRYGAVEVQGGRVARVGPRDEICAPGRQCRSLDFGEAAVLPGLVNAHAHLDVTLLRGLCEDLDFFSWIRRLTAIKSRHLEPADFRLGARWGALEMVRAGITTVGDTSDQGVTLDALLESGQRGVAYEEVFGPDERDCEQAMQILQNALDERRPRATGRVRVGVSPHAPYSVSTRLLGRVAELVLREDLPVAIHVDESLAERRFVRHGEGPFADFLRSRGIPVRPLGDSTISVLDALGFLRTRPLLIHAVHAGPGDIEKVRQTGAKIVHCPCSNAKLAHGTAPLCEFLRREVATGLGTDGAVSNNACDLFEQARCAVFLQRVRAERDSLDLEALTPRVLLRLMTLGGAETLGLSEETGSLEPGKAADITVVGLSAPHLQPVHDPEVALIYSATGQDVILTMVEGRILYQQGVWNTFDVESLRRDLVEATRKFGTLS